MARASAFSFGLVYGSIKLKYLKVLLPSLPSSFCKFSISNSYARLIWITTWFIAINILIIFVSIKFLSFIEFRHSWQLKIQNSIINLKYMFHFHILKFGPILILIFLSFLSQSLESCNFIIEFKKISILIFHNCKELLMTYKKQ